MSMLGCELKSIEVRPEGTCPDKCSIVYDKIILDPDEDLDFVVKSRHGNVPYHIRRVLHYMRDTGKTKLGGILKVLEPRDVYEIEVYKEEKKDA